MIPDRFALFLFIQLFCLRRTASSSGQMNDQSLCAAVASQRWAGPSQAQVTSGGACSEWSGDIGRVEGNQPAVLLRRAWRTRLHHARTPSLSGCVACSIPAWRHLLGNTICNAMVCSCIPLVCVTARCRHGDWLAGGCSGNQNTALLIVQWYSAWNLFFEEPIDSAIWICSLQARVRCYLPFRTWRRLLQSLF
jgi:hypothetical protein